MNQETWYPRVAALLQAGRLLLVPACVLGSVWLLDGSSADSLAPKALCFALAAGLLPALGAARLWWGQSFVLPPSRVLLGLLAWCAAFSLAYAASPLKGVSQDAWQAWLLTVLLFVGAVDYFQGEGARRWFLRSLALGAALAGMRSLAQRLGLDTSVTALQEHAAFGGRVASSFGNPNFAGGFFVLALPLLFYLAICDSGRLWRLLARAAAGLALLGLALSASKAALLGLVEAAAVAGHLLFWSDATGPLKRRAVTWLAGGLAGALLVGSLCLPADSWKRLAGGPSAWGESVAFRRVTWEGTLDLGAARPLWGWGPGSFSAAYPAYRRSEAMAAQTEHAYEVGAPENWVLQIFAECGLLGLASALGLLLVFLLPLRQAARAWAADPARAGLCLALLTSVAACLACNLASLDLFLPSTLLSFVLLLALGVTLTTQDSRSLSVRPGLQARFLASSGLLFLACIPPVQAQLHSQAARLLAQGRGLSEAGHFDAAIPVYTMALQFDPSLLEARYFLALSLLDAGGDTGLAKAGEIFHGLQRYAPDYVQVHAKLGRLALAQGRVDEAALEYTRQLALDPWDLATVQALASLDAEHGRLAQARDVLAQASERWPDNLDLARNLALVNAALRGRKGKP